MKYHLNCEKRLGCKYGKWSVPTNRFAQMLMQFCPLLFKYILIIYGLPLPAKLIKK